ncbi:MAG: hypothetical protein LBT00_07675 [Spirochaetaceae bacterium]|nr:hypothetical protein [Spirochaetaceae bacterium]
MPGIPMRGKGAQSHRLLVWQPLLIAMTGRVLSLRDAKRRSNPDGGGIHTGLLRFARNDEGLPQ